ncbi:MAG: alkaline phosphatase family protein, partial [Actinomycetota bacterium]
GVVTDRGRVATPVTLADAAPMTAGLIGDPSFEAPDGRGDPGLAAGERARLVVTIVWDGGGWNTLREHPDSWPTLRSLMSKGSGYVNATIGSTPSNTPPIHTTLGTGAFPRTHGIPHVKMRTASGDYVDPFEGDDASEVRVPSLADVYDPTTGNEAQVGVVATVNWHLGMIGRGAGAPGGDRDLAVLLNAQGLTYGNDELYEIPAVGDPVALEAATEQLDVADGEADGRWKDDDLSDPAVRYATPAFIDYQQQILERVIAERGFGADEIPDLLYVNFKQVDDAGHRWGLRSPQVAANIEASDRALERLTAFLDRQVGRGRWAVAVTADHGQTLYPHQSGGWPIAGGELAADIEREFSDDGVDVFRVISSGIFLADRAALTDGTAQRVGEWVAGYTAGENLPGGKEMPEGWEGREDERLFSAVLAGREVVASVCENG